MRAKRAETNSFSMSLTNRIGAASNIQATKERLSSKYSVEKYQIQMGNREGECGDRMKKFLWHLYYNAPSNQAPSR